MMIVRLGTKTSQQELDSKIGKIVTDDDYNLLLTRACTVTKPGGQVLCIYLPGVLLDLVETGHVYEVLHPLKTMLTDNRGKASGSERIRFTGDSRTRSKKVASAILGSMDAMGPKKYCRQTSWTGKNTERLALLYPLLRRISEQMALHAPMAYRRQKAMCDNTDPAWVIPGTVFTTITVNNTYPTGVHTDKGDYEHGISTLATLRYGQYTGGRLVFPEWRVAADMGHGDLMLMDAHDFHGNTAIVKAEPDPWSPNDPERISLVSYFRTGMVECGTPDQEIAKMRAYADSAAAAGGTVR